MKRIGLPGRV